VYWKGRVDWEFAETSPYTLERLEYELLEPYVERAVPSFLEKACNGPRHMAVIFQLVRMFSEVSDSCLATFTL
jgi:hypothetical protein